MAPTAAQQALLNKDPAAWSALGNYLNGLNGVAQPDPTELATWQNQRTTLGDTYGTANAQNAFDRTQTLANQAAETAALARQWTQTRNALPGQYAKRNLLNSGIYGGALQQYGSDRAAATDALALKYQTTLGQLGLNAQAAQTAYTSGTSQVNNSEAARRESLAASLKGVV